MKEFNKLKPIQINEHFDIDHVFIYIEKDETRLLQKLRSSGFVVEVSRDHGDQGTKNFLLYFQNLYVEFIWAESIHKVKNLPFKSIERARHRESGASPFGIAFRGDGHYLKQIKEEFAVYDPPYSPGNLIYLSRSNENMFSPFWFIMESNGKNSQEFKPANSVEPKLLSHSNGAQSVRMIEVSGPNYGSLQKSEQSLISFHNNSEFKMRILVDGNKVEDVHFNELLSFRIRHGDC